LLPQQWRHLYNCFNPSRHPSFDVSELIFEDQTIKDDICSFIEARATSASAKQVAAKQKRKARDSEDEDSDDELVAANVNQASSLPAKARQSPKKKSKAIVVEAPKKKGLAKKQKKTRSPRSRKQMRPLSPM
jgi:hypothetical protein